MNFAISRSEREWLTTLIAYGYFIADDFRVRQARERGVGPEQLAQEFGDEMRLLADLGWFGPRLIQALGLPSVEAEEYEVTMLSPEALIRTLGRLREAAGFGAAHFATPRPSCESDWEAQERRLSFQLAKQTCEEILSRLE